MKQDTIEPGIQLVSASTRKRKPRGIDTDEAIQAHILENSTEVASGCLIWNGCKNNMGYGVTAYKSKQVLAHRVSYTVFNGPIPDARFVCHYCDTPDCVAPNHLYAGTARRNQEDVATRGRDGKRRAVASRTASRLRPDMAVWNKNSYWINNGFKNSRISKEQPLPEGWIKGRRRNA